MAYFHSLLWFSQYIFINNSKFKFKVVPQFVWNCKEKYLEIIFSKKENNKNYKAFCIYVFR